MAEVTQIVIKIGDKEIPLTMQEARELRRVLDDLLGERIVINPSPSIVPYPVYPVPYTPPYRWWTVTVGDAQYPVTITATNTLTTNPAYIGNPAAD